MRQVVRRGAANLRRLLQGCRLYPFRDQESRYEAGGQYQQGSGVCREIRRPAPDDFLHRQPAEGCCRSGCTKYEPNVWH